MEGYTEQANNQDTLNLMKMIHGENVMCTNGLFHILDDKHNEVYINNKTGELDKRALYKTVVVMDKIIVAKVVNNKQIKYVVLNKDNLDCTYKTDGTICYIDNNLIYDENKDMCTVISHTGRILGKLNDIRSIKNAYGVMYIAQSSLMFSDKVLYYNFRQDTLEDLTEGKEYAIQFVDKDQNQIEVYNMFGGRYIYDFKTRKCLNKFTGKIEEETQLWKVI